jgi:hypothetical protein
MATPPPFLISAWQQPIANFDRLIADGYNAVVGHETEGGRVTKAAWEAEAAARGLFFVTTPGTDLAGEARQPFRRAWMQDDEPDGNRWSDKPGADNARLVASGTFKGWTLPELLGARFMACKAAAPSMPVWVNFAGPNLTNPDYKGEQHVRYLAAADEWCFDFYCKNKDPMRYPLFLMARCFDRLATWSGFKSGMGYVEASDQSKTDKGRAPTPDELEDEVNLLVACGARGVVYFHHSFDIGWPAGWWGTPPELEARIASVNGRLNYRFNGGPALGPSNDARIARLEGDVARLRAGLRAV